MNYQLKALPKKILFYSLFIIIFSIPSFAGVDQTNKAPLQPQILNELQNSHKKPSKYPDNQAQRLNEVIDLILKTAIGKELTPFINALMDQNKIQLTDLEDGHYGESGEGCVVKEGKYFYEGFFMLLSNKLSITETASALVHEVTHFLMIQKNIASNIKPQHPVSFFEISAFAVQHHFITELQQLNLADPQTMFSGETQTVLEIMQNAYDYKKTASQTTYNKVLEQLVAYGYPLEELNRLVSSRSEQECIAVSNPI